MSTGEQFIKQTVCKRSIVRDDTQGEATTEAGLPTPTSSATWGKIFTVPGPVFSQVSRVDTSTFSVASEDSMRSAKYSFRYRVSQKVMIP